MKYWKYRIENIGDGLQKCLIKFKIGKKDRRGSLGTVEENKGKREKGKGTGGKRDGKSSNIYLLSLLKRTHTALELLATTKQPSKPLKWTLVEQQMN